MQKASRKTKKVERESEVDNEFVIIPDGTSSIGNVEKSDSVVDIALVFAKKNLRATRSLRGGRNNWNKGLLSLDVGVVRGKGGNGSCTC